LSTTQLLAARISKILNIARPFFGDFISKHIHAGRIEDASRNVMIDSIYSSLHDKPKDPNGITVNTPAYTDFLDRVNSIMFVPIFR